MDLNLTNIVSIARLSLWACQTNEMGGVFQTEVWKLVNQITEGEVEHIVDLARVESSRVKAKMAGVLHNETTSIPSTGVLSRDHLRTILYMRDDLEWVKRLLNWAGHPGVLNEFLLPVDRLGNGDFMALVMHHSQDRNWGTVFYNDHKLKKARELDPNAWWAHVD